MDAKVLAWDFLRHDFDLRELRILFAILLRTGPEGKARLERKFFEKRLGIRDDHARRLCAGLQKARVLCAGWDTDEVFVLQRNCDLWRRDELALRDEQFVLPLESGDAGLLFAQAVATADTHGGFSPTVGETLGGLDEKSRQASTLNPQPGDGQERSGGACECPEPRTFPQDCNESLRETLRASRTCFACAVNRGLVRSLVRTYNSEKVQQRTNGAAVALEAMLAREEWREPVARFAGFGPEVRGQVARGYVPKTMGGWLRTVLRKYENNQRKENV